jgi:hypothetical protein
MVDPLGIGPPPAAGGNGTQEDRYYGGSSAQSPTMRYGTAKYGDPHPPAYQDFQPKYGPQAPATATQDAVSDPRIQDYPAEVVAKIQAGLRIGGLIPDSAVLTRGGVDNATQAGWNDLLGYANRYAVDWQTALGELTTDPVTGKKRTTPVSTYGGTNKSTGTTTDTTTTEALFTDPVTARATVRSAMSQRLGRDPTDHEYARFQKLLHGKEAGPDVQTRTTKHGTTTTTTGTQENSTTSTTGADTSTVTRQDDTVDPSASDVADEFSRQGTIGTEANTFHAATDLYGAAMKALGAGGGFG